jgi:hypothetical protein
MNIMNEKEIVEIYEDIKPSVPKLNYSFSQLKVLITEIGKFEITNYDHYGLKVLAVGTREFAIGTEDEADDAWEDALDAYLEDCIYPELPRSIQNYFDSEKWKRDARYDGRGHCLSSYDGCETEVANLVMFRIN